MRVVRLETLEQFAAVNVLLDPGYLPGPKIIPNAVMVRLNWSLTSGKIAHNVLYAGYNGTPALTNAVAQTLYAAIINGTNWSTLAGFLAPTGSLTGVTLLDVRSNAGQEFTSTGAASPGTSSGTALPDEVAAVVTLKTDNRGPSGRGRYYVPNFATNALAAGNTIAAATVAALQAWSVNNVYTSLGTQFQGQVLGLPARAAYTSPVTGRQFPARAAVAVPVRAVNVRDNHWDTQRRRGLK